MNIFPEFPDVLFVNADVVIDPLRISTSSADIVISPLEAVPEICSWIPVKLLPLSAPSMAKVPTFTEISEPCPVPIEVEKRKLPLLISKRSA